MKSYVTVLKHSIYNRLNIVTRPSFCTFIVTWRCNLKCEMCSIWKKERTSEMNPDQVETVFSKVKSVRYVRITGGEPFMRVDFSKVVGRIIQSIFPRLIHITTNGFFTDRVCELLDTHGKPSLHLKISIDGPEEVHDSIRAVKGSFVRAFETLKRASKIAAAKGAKLGVNFTISENNMDKEQISFVMDMCKEYGAELIFDFAYAPPPLYDEKTVKGIDNAYEYFAGNKRKFIDIIDFIESKPAPDIFIERLKQKYFLKGIKNRILKNIGSPNPKCVELNSHFRMLPDGSVTVCLYKPQIVGNLLSSSFNDVWFSKEAEIYRKEVRDCGGCWAGCETGPNAIYTGDIIKGMF